jgi:predicted RNA-binding Zn ribbon-like protein
VADDAFDQPAGREPAPGELAVVQAFVNTYMKHLDGSGGVEHLQQPRDLERFLDEHDALAPRAGPVRVTRAELEHALAVREALRALAAVNNGKPLPEAARATLEAAADAAGLTLRFGAGTERRTLTAAGPGVPAALGRLLATVATAMADGSWARVKSCAQPNCGWIFFDRSNNRSSRWCTMAICGSRAKMTAHRRRRAGRRAGR